MKTRNDYINIKNIYGLPNEGIIKNGDEYYHYKMEKDKKFDNLIEWKKEIMPGTNKTFGEWIDIYLEVLYVDKEWRREHIEDLIEQLLHHIRGEV